LFSYLAGETGGDDDNVGALQGLWEALLHAGQSFLDQVSDDRAIGVDVTQVGRNTRHIDNIIERELINERTRFKEKRQWLSNST
jgi:hypothetical protein